MSKTQQGKARRKMRKFIVARLVSSTPLWLTGGQDVCFDLLIGFRGEKRGASMSETFWRRSGLASKSDNKSVSRLKSRICFANPDLLLSDTFKNFCSRQGYIVQLCAGLFFSRARRKQNDYTAFYILFAKSFCFVCSCFVLGKFSSEVAKQTRPFLKRWRVLRAEPLASPSKSYLFTHHKEFL